jgi:hypothetical protein
MSTFDYPVNHWPRLFTKPIWQKLIQNNLESITNDISHKPVVKIFTPDAGCTWLLSDVDADNPDIAFGLCDLGLGFPELGYVSLQEITSLRGALGLPVERDRHFQANKTLVEYADEANQTGGIRA